VRLKHQVSNIAAAAQGIGVQAAQVDVCGGMVA